MPKKQSDGRYRAKITIGHTADGKPITKYVSGGTKRELEEAKAAARKHFIDGAVSRQDMLFGEYALLWYKAKKEPNLSASSCESYATHLNKHILPAYENRMLRSIQPMELQIWLNGYAGKSKTTITMIYSILRAVFRSACGEGILHLDPTQSLARPKPKQAATKRAFTKEECARVEKTIQTHEDGLFLGVLYYLGVRRGEALGLQWQDVDWQNRRVHIARDIDYANDSSGRVGELKTKASYREIPIPDPFMSLLRAKRGLPSVSLFCTEANNPWPKTTFQRRWMLLMADAGFATPVERQTGVRPDPRFDWETDITPHFFRHNYTTMLYDAGVDALVAMRILGHADYATTAKIYTHLNNMHIDDAEKKINEKLSGKKVAKKLPATRKDITKT